MESSKSNQARSGKIRSTQVFRHPTFLVLGILSWLGFSYLFLLFIKLGQGRSLSNFPWHYDAPIWAFRECLIGAAAIIFIKWKFDLLTEKSKSVLRDFVVLLSLIPINSLITTSYMILGLGLVYAGGGASKEYEFAMSFLSGFIKQTFVAMTCIGYFYLTLVNKTKEKLAAAQQVKTEMELKTLRQNIEAHFLFSQTQKRHSTARNEKHRFLLNARRNSVGFRRAGQQIPDPDHDFKSRKLAGAASIF